MAATSGAIVTLLLATGPSVNTLFFCIDIATFLLENQHILIIKLHLKRLVLLLKNKMAIIST